MYLTATPPFFPFFGWLCTKGFRSSVRLRARKSPAPNWAAREEEGGDPIIILIYSLPSRKVRNYDGGTEVDRRWVGGLCREHDKQAGGDDHGGRPGHSEDFAILQ